MVTAEVLTAGGQDHAWEPLGQAKVMDGVVQANTPALRFLLRYMSCNGFDVRDGEPFLLSLPEYLERTGRYRVELSGRSRIKARREAEQGGLRRSGRTRRPPKARELTSQEG